jgi:vacuolar-type H+-ATPase subunit I/STV1
MGFSVALTGFVLFAFGMVFGTFCYAEPRNMPASRFFGVFVLIGLFAIPVGLIIQIWQ